MEKLEEFKTFVKTKPELISHVRNGDMTWQKFFEIWDLYGPNHSEWSKFSGVSLKGSAASIQETFGLTEIFNAIKKVDMENVRKNIAGIQKAIGLIQDITGKGDGSSVTNAKEPYQPRPIYRRFED